MKISNMLSSKGNKIPNQFIIEDNGIIYFQSYEVICAKKENGKIYLDERYYNYSMTTIRYRNQFLNANSKEIETRIKSGEYTLCNLN